MEDLCKNGRTYEDCVKKKKEKEKDWPVIITVKWDYNRLLKKKRSVRGPKKVDSLNNCIGQVKICSVPGFISTFFSFHFFFSSFFVNRSHVCNNAFRCDSGLVLACTCSNQENEINLIFLQVARVNEINAKKI